MTTTIIKIAELTEKVNNALTHTAEGREDVVIACKNLYNLIEEDVVNADKEWMLKGMYEDLCSGNFAEPFMCEKKKETYTIIVEVYNTRVVPYL